MDKLGWEVEFFGEEGGERGDAEGFGGVMAGVDEVDVVFVGEAEGVVGAFACDVGVEFCCDDGFEVSCAAGDDADFFYFFRTAGNEFDFSADDFF